MGGGVIKEVSGKLVDQFAKNLAEMLGEGSPSTQPTPEAAAAAGPATPTARCRRPRRPSPRPPADAHRRRGCGPGDADGGAAGRGRRARCRSLVGPMIVSRLKDPKVLGGLGLLIAILLLLKRRS